jgi:hypothetical protein
MKLKKLTAVIISAFMFFSFSGCNGNESSENSEQISVATDNDSLENSEQTSVVTDNDSDMNLEKSRDVMDAFINQEQYAIMFEYEGMNLEYYYAKDGENEFLGSTVGNIQSGVFRFGNVTYYVDIVGSGELRRIENDETDINAAVTVLDTIYYQTVVNGKCISQSVEDDEIYNTYEYDDTEKSGDIIEWQTVVGSDGKLIKATRVNDSRIFAFSYPEYTDKVFYIPEEYIIVDDDGNPVNGTAGWADYPTEN